MQQFDKFEPSTNNTNTGGGMSSSNSPTGPIGGPFSGSGAAPSMTGFQSSLDQHQHQQPLVSPLHPAMPQFSLTPLNIAENNSDLYEGNDESRDSESPISDVEITS